MEIRGKHVLVTGGGRRIGRALAFDAAARGARVTVHYRTSRDEAEAVAEKIRGGGGEAVAIRAELTDRREIERLVAAAIEAFGAIDALYCSAAIFRKTPWAAVTEEDWDAHLGANLKSVFLLVRAAAPKMNDGGAIVTFGDWSALRAYRNFLPYHVSKAGVVALTKALAQELAPRLRVNCVCPGTVLPPENASDETLEKIRRRTPLQRLGAPEDLLAAVRFLVEATDFATGSVVVVDGGRLVADPEYG